MGGIPGGTALAGGLQDPGVGSYGASLPLGGSRRYGGFLQLHLGTEKAASKSRVLSNDNSLVQRMPFILCPSPGEDSISGRSCLPV